jgi:Uma2 family endonuclease
MAILEQAEESGAELAEASRRISEDRFFLPGISWRLYDAMLTELGNRPGIRLTYDRGSLELMTLSFLHERMRRRIALLVQVIAEESGLDYQGCGSTTLKLEGLQRGLESDEGFYIAHEAQIRGKTEIDLLYDPPPDLGVEVEITHGMIDRMGIYAALRIPEIWRLGEQLFRVLLLGEDGEYRESLRSTAFPRLPVSELLDLLRQTDALSESGAVRAFRTWVKSWLANGKE